MLAKDRSDFPWFVPRSFVLALPLALSAISVLAEESNFPKQDLVLWLDAADTSTLKIDADQVLQWDDKSGHDHHAVASTQNRPLLISGDGPMVRFTPGDTPTPLHTPVLFPETSPVTVFVVSQRGEEQADRGDWQRLLSAREPDNKDHLGNGIAMTLTPRGKGHGFPAAIYSSFKDSVASLPMTLGTTAPGQPGGGLKADVAEILIYNRAFSDPSEFEAVQDYLAQKWNVDAARDAGGWTREGDTPPSLTHTTTDAPLFDQANATGWQPYPAMTDEFDGDSLDQEKWWDHYPSWHGRAPARFLPENIKVADGMLQLTLRKDDSLPREKLHADNDADYYGYSAAAVVSKTALTYGCFEVRIRPAHATCTSSWWFNGGATNEDGVERRTELDVFELPAGAKGFEKKFGMNMHIFKEPETSEHWSNWGNWYAPFAWSEDFHTVNFVWSPNWIRYYVDGHCVRTTRNVAWHVPLQMIFDMEIMSWLPFPDDSEFPAHYKIDYVRAWTHPDWKGDPQWTPKPDPSKPSNITEAVRKLTAQRQADQSPQ
ncbi:Beta-porphyranase A precursor [Rubripirellula amarantea]|uniref:Beta-porphyranase A n=1 Tax=Rubripirellula amarantea TaxID=2527999 RepID=A0A5C5WTM9_9BACT|nr:family 16 glycosylhydrolase [Rubripirellula amarantea]TWT54027.1 Beta-porphyranase A precursor [Rubripirellula amarantea]